MTIDFTPTVGQKLGFYYRSDYPHAEYTAVVEVIKPQAPGLDGCILAKVLEGAVGSRGVGVVTTVAAQYCFPWDDAEGES